MNTNFSLPAHLAATSGFLPHHSCQLSFLFWLSSPFQVSLLILGLLLVFVEGRERAVDLYAHRLYSFFCRPEYIKNKLGNCCQQLRYIASNGSIIGE
jgi:hypothetical protein